MQKILESKIVLAIGSLAFGLLMLSVGAHRATAWGITWSDEFTGAATAAQPWSGNWSYQTGGNNANNEPEIYVNSWANSHMIWDGTGTDSQALQIEAQTGGGKWYSARINTYGRHTFGPGTYVEFRCKFPNSGQGYWPACWMLGTVGGQWPACGEMDVAEEVDGQWENHQSLHMPGWDPTVVWTVNNSTSTYHTYGVWWPADTNSITFNMDGANSATFYRGQAGTWEFNSNQQMYIIINLAMGGNFPGNTNGSTQPNGNFDIDYVRQYN